MLGKFTYCVLLVLAIAGGCQSTGAKVESRGPRKTGAARPMEAVTFRTLGRKERICMTLSPDGAVVFQGRIIGKLGPSQAQTIWKHVVALTKLLPGGHYRSDRVLDYSVEVSHKGRTYVYLALQEERNPDFPKPLRRVVLALLGSDVRALSRSAKEAYDSLDNLGANATIRRRLKEKIRELDFKNDKLADVIQFLMDVSGVSIDVQWGVLSESGVTRGTKIALRVQEVSLEDAIHAVLAEAAKKANAEFTFTVHAGQIVVSTKHALDLGKPYRPPKKTKPQRDAITFRAWLGTKVPVHMTLFRDGTFTYQGHRAGRLPGVKTANVWRKAAMLVARLPQGHYALEDPLDHSLEILQQDVKYTYVVVKSGTDPPAPKLLMSVFVPLYDLTNW